MKKKFIIYLVLFLVMMFIADIHENYIFESEIYQFLSEELELNEAAIWGVIANIKEECNYNPNKIEKGYTWEDGGGYGICQWTNYPRESSSGRRTELVNYCNNNNLDYTTLNGQLYYLKFELENNVKGDIYSNLKNTFNNSDGAYCAGYIWCYSFETPDGYDTGVSEKRGNKAKKLYHRHNIEKKIKNLFS